MAFFQVPRGDEIQRLQTTCDSGSSDADVESAKMSGDVPGQSFAQKRKRQMITGGTIIASLGALAVIVAHVGGDAKPFAPVNVGGLEAKTGGAYNDTITTSTTPWVPVVDTSVSTTQSEQPIPSPISSSPTPISPTLAPTAAPTAHSVSVATSAPSSSQSTQTTQSVPVAPTTQSVPGATSAPPSTFAPSSTQSNQTVQAATAAPSVSTGAPLVSTNTTTPNPIVPVEVPGDGDPCDSSSEEFHDGLCYEKCNNLTKGAYPYRLNAFCCCKKKKCSVMDLFSTDTKCPSMTPCGNGGYDVDADGKACPHPIGACYNDEETLVGECYKKCTILTGGKFPHRVGPATCCKSSSDLTCMNPFNDITNAKFAVGGGKGDGDPNTKGGIHEPIKELTESKKSK